LKEIEKYIATYFGIESSDLSTIGDLFEENVIKKNEFLLRTGQYTRSLSFIKSGYIRVFASTEDGDKEITQWISSSGTFITDLSSFIFDSPARWMIQALTDCEMYTISKDNYKQIGKLAGNWVQLEKLFIAKCFITLENRVFGQLSMSAEQKVRSLLAQSPFIFNEVPLQYIASMLGMTPETLSRVRKKLSS